MLYKYTWVNNQQQYSQNQNISIHDIFGYYKSSFIVFFSTNVFSCVFIFMLWIFIFDKNFFNKNKKDEILNYFFTIYILFIFFIIANFGIFKLVTVDFHYFKTITWGIKLVKKVYISTWKSFWNVSNISVHVSFIFSVLTFLFFNSFIYKMYINKEKWNYDKIYFIPLILISQIALTTLIFAKNFVVIYTSIELFSMIIYYIIIFESINNKISANSNVYNTELSLKYFIISLFGSINILIGIGFIFYSFGCLDFHTMKMYFRVPVDGIEYFSGTGIKFGFITFIIGILVKMGIAPYHFWINGVYDRFTNHFFEYMSIFPKSIIICFLLNLFSRLTLCYPNDTIISLNNFFSIIGIINVIFGTFSSINQTDLKRIIMYSSLSNIGYIFMAMGANHFVVSTAYSYIIHYTIALFILFRVLNYIEISQKKNFKQWYFAEFSVLTIQNKIFLTIAILNLSGLPPFTIFFNKFFILSFLWKHEAYFSVAIMTIFSAISYSYYFNIIKFIWFNEKFSNFTGYSHFYNDIKLNKFINSTKFSFFLETFNWEIIDNVEEKLVFEKKVFKYDDYYKIVEASSIYEDWIKSFCFAIEKIITRIFLFSSFLGFFSVIFFIKWINYSFDLRHSIKGWLPLWLKDRALLKQVFYTTEGIVTKKKKLANIKSQIHAVYNNEYSLKYDYFHKWANFTSYKQEKSNTYIIHSFIDRIDIYKINGNGGPINIDKYSNILYMIDKYFLSVVSTYFLIAFSFYIWVSNGNFRNFLLGLTLMKNAIYRMVQVLIYYIAFKILDFMHNKLINLIDLSPRRAEFTVKLFKIAAKNVFLFTYSIVFFIVYTIIYEIEFVIFIFVARVIVQRFIFTNISTNEEKINVLWNFEAHLTVWINWKLRIKKEIEKNWNWTVLTWEDYIESSVRKKLYWIQRLEPERLKKKNK